MNTLTQKQIGFANDVFAEIPLNQAYKNHYNTAKMLSATIDVEASLLASNPKIAKRLAELNAAVKSDLIADEIERKEILSEIARGKLSQFTDDTGVIDRAKLNSSAIQGIDEQTIMGKLATVIKLRLHNPINAIAELNKMEKVYEPESKVINNLYAHQVIINSNGAGKGKPFKEIIDATEQGKG